VDALPQVGVSLGDGFINPELHLGFGAIGWLQHIQQLLPIGSKDIVGKSQPMGERDLKVDVGIPF
jgi:hypothetical protein